MTRDRIVILVGAAVDPGPVLAAGGPAPLGSHRGPTALVSASEPSDDVGYPAHVVPASQGLADRALRILRIPELGRILTRSPAGRLVDSFSPADQSRVFLRAVRNDPEAMALVSGASLVVAADLPAVRTAWFLLHSGTVPHAIYGLAAAARYLARASADSAQ